MHLGNLMFPIEKNTVKAFPSSFHSGLKWKTSSRELETLSLDLYPQGEPIWVTLQVFLLPSWRLNHTYTVLPTWDNKVGTTLNWNTVVGHPREKDTQAKKFLSLNIFMTRHDWFIFPRCTYKGEKVKKSVILILFC